MTNHIKACAFCDGLPELVQTPDVAVITCTACGASGPTRRTAAEAIAGWNRRSPAMVSRLREPPNYSPEILELARQALEAQRSDTRTDEDIARDGADFICATELDIQPTPKNRAAIPPFIGDRPATSPSLVAALDIDDSQRLDWFIGSGRGVVQRDGKYRFHGFIEQGYHATIRAAIDAAMTAERAMAQASEKTT
ncbi:hypothetical protein F6X40_09480 [Paraburkholderia sp. UCT31]|uniref:Lar family restriction alleviation protein n=1 Tax=Paraburkholderia sp. UCT31 TaxID=2615209 RepID=UPI0016557F21|nr:Lar family restriction alleviation protein [Paraburkholderia sp. UCT31]MBC8737039.1 hypothetical protein [Paraburkholderia sp. UCT31]